MKKIINPAPEGRGWINLKLVVSIIILSGVMLLAGCGTSKQSGTDVTSYLSKPGGIILPPDKVGAPKITVTGGKFSIKPIGSRYTTDGTIPTATSTPYTGVPVTVSFGTTIKAIKFGVPPSPMATFYYGGATVAEIAIDPPKFSYAPGPSTAKPISTMAFTPPSPQTKYVSIYNQTPGAETGPEIRYRVIAGPGTGRPVSKTEMFISSTKFLTFIGAKYIKPIQVKDGDEIEAYVKAPNGLTSPVARFKVQGLPKPEFTGSLTSPTGIAAPPYTLTVNVTNFKDQPTGTEILYKYASIQETLDFVKPYCVSTTNPNIVIPGITYPTPTAYVRLRFYDANQNPSNGPIASGDFTYTYTPPPAPTVPAPTITYPNPNFVWGAGGTNQLTLTVTKPANGRIQYTYGASAGIPDPTSSYSEFTPYDSATTATIVRPNISYNKIYLKLRAQIPDPLGTPTPISSTVVGPYDYTCTPPQTADLTCSVTILYTSPQNQYKYTISTPTSGATLYYCFSTPSNIPPAGSSSPPSWSYYCSAPHTFSGSYMYICAISNSTTLSRTYKLYDASPSSVPPYPYTFVPVN